MNPPVVAAKNQFRAAYMQRWRARHGAARATPTKADMATEIAELRAKLAALATEITELRAKLAAR